MVNQYTKEHSNSFTYNSVTSSSTISCKMLRICASILHIISLSSTQYINITVHKMNDSCQDEIATNPHDKLHTCILQYVTML